MSDVTVYIDNDDKPYLASGKALLRIINASPFSQKITFSFDDFKMGDVSDFEWYLYAVNGVGNETRFTGTPSTTANEVEITIYNRASYDKIQLWSYDDSDSMWTCHHRPIKIEYQNVVYA